MNTRRKILKSGSNSIWIKFRASFCFCGRHSLYDIRASRLMMMSVLKNMELWTFANNELIGADVRAHHHVWVRQICPNTTCNLDRLRTKKLSQAFLLLIKTTISNEFLYESQINFLAFQRKVWNLIKNNSRVWCTANRIK